MTDTPARDEQAVLKFVERFAADLSDNGFPRMPARVFALLLATDSGQLTASELAERLQVSPAAISGAVRYLVLVNFATRQREVGSRRDIVRVNGQSWMEGASRDQIYARIQATMQEGTQLLGTGTPAGQRIAETAGFFGYLRAELPLIMQRWRERGNPVDSSPAAQHDPRP